MISWRKIRESNEPFGGIRLVLSGDFCQLPPVEQEQDKQFTYAFEAKSWSKCVPHQIELTQVYRQSGDLEYLTFLQDLRYGYVSPNSIRRLIELEREVKIEDGVELTQLYGTRAEVEDNNRLEMRKLRSEAYYFRAEDYEQQFGYLKTLLISCLALSVLELKVGAQVMLIKNLSHLSLYNGKKGIVVGFDKEAGNCPIVKFVFDNGTETTHTIYPEWWHREVENPKVEGGFERVAGRQQIPLVPAWAMTIHKSQGQTIERLKVDCAKIFTVGHVYVALSRCPNSKYLQVVNFHVNKVMTDVRVRRYYLNLRNIREGKPLVKDLPTEYREEEYYNEDDYEQE